MKGSSQIHIGTSGWYYDHWRGPFYPIDLADREMLPYYCRSGFEFRDPSWFNEDVYEVLRGAGAAFCIYDLAGNLSPKIVTGPIVYVRLHGPDGPYRGRYSDQALAGWLLPLREAGESCPRCGGCIECLEISGRHAYCCRQHQN